MKNLKGFLILLSAATVISCNSTQVVTSYKNDKVSVAPHSKILVLGIFQPKDRVFRQETETAMAAKLNDLGYHAVTSMDEYGPKAFEKMSEDEIVNRVRSGNYDAVLTTALLDKQKDKNYQPGSVSYQPVGLAYNPFGRYYSTVYDRVYSPGYYTTSTDYFLESNLYDGRNGNLVYSVQTRSFDPASAGQLADDNTKKIVKDMERKGVLTK